MSTPRVTKTAKALVEKAIRAMRQHPETVKMDIWVKHDDRVQGKEPYCGTAACIAGHITLAAGAPKTGWFTAEEVDPKYRRYAQAVDSTGAVTCATFVRSLFGIEPFVMDDPTDTLFARDTWPTPYRKAYKAARRDHKERARVTIARLRHWLKTGE